MTCRESSHGLSSSRPSLWRYWRFLNLKSSAQSKETDLSLEFLCIQVAQHEVWNFKIYLVVSLGVGGKWSFYALATVAIGKELSQLLVKPGWISGMLGLQWLRHPGPNISSRLFTDWSIMEVGTKRCPKMTAVQMASISLQNILLLLSMYCIAAMKRDNQPWCS